MDTYDLALELEHRNVQTLTAKASTLKSMGRHKEAKDCNDLAYAMDQNFFLDFHPFGMDIENEVLLNYLFLVLILYDYHQSRTGLLLIRN
jgi:hypothetical protein